MKIAITMRVADRSPRTNYLRQTIDNLRRSEVFISPYLSSFDVVTSHPPTAALRRALSTLPDMCTVHASSRILTPNECATEAHVVANSRNADYILFLEDDLDFCSDFLGSVCRWLSGHAESQYPVFVFGSVAPSCSGRPALPQRVHSFFGTQSYAVHSSRHSHLTEWLSRNLLYRGRPRYHDLRLHLWADEIRATHFLLSQPCFVSHIGIESGMGCPPVIFQSWQGHDWSYSGEAA